MIVTFYSFKGGVGRSASLLEAAAQLAAMGRSVVVWDLDLEAPGVQKNPALAEIDRGLEGGTLDLLEAFQAGGLEEFPEEILKRSVQTLDSPRITQSGGRLGFLLPGRLDEDYPHRFAAIDWGTLFKPPEGPGMAFFFDIARHLEQDLEYDYILVDSRTGLTDLSGVCTLLLPQLLVMVFNLNEQNLAGLERVHQAATQREIGPLRFDPVPVVTVANMVPERPAEVREKKRVHLKNKGFGPHILISLHPELLLTEEIPTLAGRDDLAVDWLPLVERIEDRAEELREAERRAASDHRLRDPKAAGLGLDGLEGRHGRAVTFDRQVADLFMLQGFHVSLKVGSPDAQVDLHVRMGDGPLAVDALVDCHDGSRPAAAEQVKELAEHTRRTAEDNHRQYQAILVSRPGFTQAAYNAAQQRFVRLITYQELLEGLVDFEANLDTAIREYQGTALERLYVEQEVVLQSDLQPGEVVEARPVGSTVAQWMERPGQGFLALLGDFGAGKTSFCQRLACEMALRVRAEESSDESPPRIPVLIDLRQAGTTTLTLENLLSHHFQRIGSSKPLNPRALLHLNREGRLLLIFDGFDETIAYSEPSRFLDNLRQILRAAEGQAKVILTCRTHYFRDRPEEVMGLGRVAEEARPDRARQGTTRLYEELRERPGVEIGYLREFDEAQIEQYLQKALPPPANWQEFHRQIQETYNLRDLAERPFLLEMIVKTLPSLDTGSEAEVTLADLYDHYCEGWFRHTDLRLTLTRKHKEALVEYLACLVWNADGQSVHYETLYEKSAEFFGDRSLSLHDKERIDYEVRTALFLRRNAEGFYSFVHRSFLEYFVARTLRRGLVAQEASCLKLRRLTREVAFFLEQWPERERIPDLAQWVLKAPYQPRVSENALLLLYFHTLAQEGPLLGPEAEALEDFTALNRRFAKWRPAGWRLEGAELSAVDLRGIHLSGVQVQGANFERADLRGASFRRADLAQAHLAFADLRGAAFFYARLPKADLNHADGRGANFSNANLSGTDLRFGHFARAIFQGVRSSEFDTLGAGFLEAHGLELTLDETAGPPRSHTFELMPQLGHALGVQEVAWHPNGLLLATGSSDGSLRLWDTRNGALLRTFRGHLGQVQTVAWDPEGNRIASGASDGELKIWDANKGNNILQIEAHKNVVLSVAWDPEGNRIASGADDGELKIWDANKGNNILQIEAHKNWVRSVAWDPEGNRIASGADDGELKIWDANKGNNILQIEAHKNWVRSVAWDPEGNRIASGADDGELKIWDANKGNNILQIEAHKNWVRSVAWDPEGNRIASGADDGELKIWDANKGNNILQIEAHKNWVLSVAWDPEGNRIASGASDGELKIWDANKGNNILQIEAHKNVVLSVAWDPEGNRIASGADDGELKIWDANKGNNILQIEAHKNWVRSVAWDPEGNRIASGASDGELKIWDANKGNNILQIEAHKNVVLSVAWDPEGNRIASGADDGELKIWDANKGNNILQIEAHKNWVRSVAWDPEGNRIASGASDGELKIWDANKGNNILQIEAHKNVVLSVAWDPEGNRIASGADDGELKIWDANKGNNILQIEAHKNWVLSVAWDPEGNRIASGADDGELKIWDANKGNNILQITTGIPALDVRWLPASDRLAVATYAGTIDIWSLEFEKPRLLARLHNLSGTAGFASTPDGYVSGPPAALDVVRFADGLALYDLEDLPERLAPDKVKAALKPT